MTALPRYLLPDTASVGDDGDLYIGGCATLDLAEEFGTPLFVYDEAHLRSRCREAVANFGEGAVYGAKAFLCVGMAALVHEEGMRIDVASGGEMYVALQADVPAERLVLHGNNKSELELQMALEAGVGRLVVDSFDEFDRIERLVGGLTTPPTVFVRVNPGIEAHTHQYLSTGQEDSKFGFSLSTGAAAEAVERARSSDLMELRGIHAHIGSQVFSVDSFARALHVIGEFARLLDLPELAMGGGLGVAYLEGESAPSITEWATVLREAATQIGLSSQIWVEPGRAIAALAAVTLYRVGTIKEIPGVRTYVSVDGGMSDNPRPVLYGSGYETFLPRAVEAPRPEAIRLVGKHCESGDLLVKEGQVPEDIAVDDIIATPVTGAYGHSMGSNYNKVLRPAVVFAKDGDARLVVQRETYEDLVRNDVDLGSSTT